MIRLLLLFALLTPQLRPPSTLRAPATPPPEGTGKFQDHTYAFRSEQHYVVIEYTPLLPAKQTVVLDAMKAACQDLYDLDFSKVKPRRARARRVAVRAEGFAHLLRKADGEPRADR